MISGAARSLQVPIYHVLYEMSYRNLLLYGASFPSLRTKAKAEPEEEVIDGDDPANNDLINKIFDESH